MPNDKQSRLRNRRERLWKSNPNCHWCKQFTILPDGEIAKDNWATIDHLRCRLHPQRHEPNPKAEQRTVLACWKCNNERNKGEMKEAGLEILQKKSGSPPASKEQLIAIVVKQASVIARLRRALNKHGLRDISYAIR
jgi:hypothetical protein